MQNFNFKKIEVCELEVDKIFGPKGKQPFIRVECDDKKFYDSITWMDGKNPSNQKYFYVGFRYNIVDEQNPTSNIVESGEYPELMKKLFDDGYFFYGTNLYKVDFIKGDKPGFKLKNQINQKEFEVYVNKEDCLLVDKNGDAIDLYGKKLGDDDTYDWLRLTDIGRNLEFLLDMAKKNKADLTVFRCVAKQQKFGAPDETAIYHFVKENLSGGQPEDIFVDSAGYEVDKDGNKKNGVDNKQYKIWEREGFDKFLDLSGAKFDSEKNELGVTVRGSLSLNSYGSVQNGKTGFFASFDFDDRNNPQKLNIFIDEKDGKIYDPTGEHLKKIDLVNQKIVDADENTCSKIIDPELYCFMKNLTDSYVFEQNSKVEYEVADQPEEIAYSSDKKDEETGNTQVVDQKTKCIRVKTKLFGQQVGECFIDLEDLSSINEVYERKDKKQGMGYCNIGVDGIVSGQKEYIHVSSNQNLFDAVKQKGYFRPPEFIIKDDAKNSPEYTDGVEIAAGQKIKAVPVTFKMVVAEPGNIVEKNLLVSDPDGLIYRVDQDQNGNKIFVRTEFNDSTGDFWDDENKECNIWNQGELREALYQKGFCFYDHELIKYYTDPDEREIEITDPEDNTKKKKIKCRYFIQKKLDQLNFDGFVDISNGNLYNTSGRLVRNKNNKTTVNGFPDLRKVLKANGMKMHSGIVGVHEVKEFEIKSDKAEQIKIGDGDNALEFEGYKISAKLDDDEAPKILYLDKADGSICDKDEIIMNFSDRSLKKLLKALNEKKLFVKTFEVSDEQKINNRVGRIVEVKIDGLSRGKAFVETPSGDIYDEKARWHRTIGYFNGNIKAFEGNVNNYDYLPDLKKALMDKGANLPKDNRFVKLEKDGNDGKGFKLKLKNPNEEIFCYVDVNGYLKILDKTKNQSVYTKKSIDLNGVELGQRRQSSIENKFLPMLRCYYKESEIKNLLEGYRNIKFEDQPWYKQPNQVFKEIKFPNKDKEGPNKFKFVLKVTTGSEDNKNLQEEKEIKGVINKAGYLENDKGDFIDINGNISAGPVLASLQPEIIKELGDELSKSLPSLEIIVDEINGHEDLLKVKIKIQPGNKEIECYVSDDGFVYEKEDKQTKMNLIIDDDNKTAELKKLNAGEDFNLLLQNADYNNLKSKIKAKKTKFLDVFTFPLVEVDKSKESNIFAFRSGSNIFYVDKATHFIVNKDGKFTDQFGNPIDFEKDEKAFEKLRHVYLNNANPDCERKCKKGIFTDQSGKIVKNPFNEEPILIKLQKRAEYFKNLGEYDKKDKKDTKSDNEVLFDLKKNLLDVLGPDVLNEFLNKFNELEKEFEANKEKSGCKNLAEYIRKKFRSHPVVIRLSVIFGGGGAIGTAAFAAILVLGLVAPLPMIIGLAVSGVSILGGLGAGLGMYFYKRNERNKFEEVEYKKNENGKEKNETVNVFEMLKGAYDKPTEKEKTEDKKDGQKKR